MPHRNLDENAFKSIPRPPRVQPKGRGHRRLSSFEIWAWSPVISFQIGLTLGYLAMIYFGVAAFIAEVPAFNHTAPDGWSAVWAAALVLGGAIAVVGSVSRAKVFEKIELAGAFLVSLTVGSYSVVLHFLSYIQGDANRASTAAGILVLAVPVLVRTLWLASQAFRR